MSAQRFCAEDARLNLSKSAVLVLQPSTTELDVLGQILIGFGVQSIRKHVSGAEAESDLQCTDFNLLLVDGDQADNAGFEFISRLRRDTASRNRLVPILLIKGHTPPSAIIRARDCGATFVLAKPITPRVLFDRLLWLVHDRREFVECDSYAGPDRRRKSFGPPPGMPGRRNGDLSAEVGACSGPDLAQSDIDALLAPRMAPTS